MEGFPLEDFSPDVGVHAPLDALGWVDLLLSQAVRSQITEAQKIAGGSGSGQDIAEAKIELEVSILLVELFLEL